VKEDNQMNQMKKTKKTPSKNYNRSMDLPNVVDMDTLAYATDEELDRHHSYLHNERERAARFDYDFRPWDDEICYVQREIQIRTSRRFAHERFLRSNPDTSNFVGSHSNDAGDLDGSNLN